MAPTKKDGEKEAKLTPDQSATLILDYLRKQNRPYSATDISANLKNRVTKAAAAKLLKDMHERKEIEGRASGKQVVYHVLQEEADEHVLENLAAMDADATRLREETVALKNEEKELRVALREGGVRVALPELKATVEKLSAEKDELAARLTKLQSGNLQPISARERAKVAKDYKRWAKTADARKKIRKELWMVVEEAIGKEKVAETKEALGLEF